MKKFTLLKLLVLSIFIGTICFTSCSNPASSGNSGSSNSSEQPADPKTTVPSIPGSTDPANPGTTDPANPGTTDPTNPGTTDPTNPGTTDPTNPGTTDPSNPGTTDPSTPGTTDPSNPGTTDPTDPTNPGNQNPEVPQKTEYTVSYVCEGCTIKLSTEKAEAGTTVTYFITCNSHYILKDSSCITIKDDKGNVVTGNGSSFVMPESDVTIYVTAVKLPDTYGKIKNFSYGIAGTTLVLQWDYDGPVDFISEYYVQEQTQSGQFTANANFAVIRNFDATKEHKIVIYAKDIAGLHVAISDVQTIDRDNFSISGLENYYSKYNTVFSGMATTQSTSDINRIHTAFGHLLGVTNDMGFMAMQASTRVDRSNSYASAYISNAQQIQGCFNKINNTQSSFNPLISKLNKQVEAINDSLASINQKLNNIKSLNQSLNSMNIATIDDVQKFNTKLSERNALLASACELQETIDEPKNACIEDLNAIIELDNSYIKWTSDLTVAANNAVYYADKLGVSEMVTSLKPGSNQAQGYCQSIMGMVNSILNKIKQL